MQLQQSDEWIIGSYLPKYDDIREFEVWTRDQVRTVRRAGNKDWFIYPPGMLVFTDCKHESSNVFCDPDAVEAWRLKQ